MEKLLYVLGCIVGYVYGFTTTLAVDFLAGWRTITLHMEMHPVLIHPIRILYIVTYPIEECIVIVINIVLLIVKGKCLSTIFMDEESLKDYLEALASGEDDIDTLVNDYMDIKPKNY